MELPEYHVLLAGRRMGPYDRRTIIGMRIKKVLDSTHSLEGTDGSLTTVAELLRRRPATTPEFSSSQSGSVSLVQAAFSANLVKVQGRGLKIPRFKDEVEVRVQGDVLRIAGRFRSGLGWKEGRARIMVADVVHARVYGCMLDLWLRRPVPDASDIAMQHVRLDLFSPESARELLDWLPAATPWPEPAPQTTAKAAASQAAKGGAAIPGTSHPLLWASLLGVGAVVAAVLVVLLNRAH